MKTAPTLTTARSFRYSIAEGESAPRVTNSAAQAKRIALRLAAESGEVKSVCRHADDMIWRTDTRRWGNS